MTEANVNEILENEENQEDVVENVNENTGATPEMENAQKRISELEAANADLKDRMMRALAEADNTRKRAVKDREDASKFAVTKFAREMLSVSDNLNRALSAVTEEQRNNSSELKALYEGVDATERELVKAFKNHDIEKIEPLGQIFDPNFHEVMFEAPISGKAAGTIIQVIDAGYTIHGRLLRPAKVGVAKGDNGSATPAEGSLLDKEI